MTLNDLNNADLIYLLLGSFVLAVFIFKPDLLIKDYSSKLIAAIASAEFFVGLILHFTEQAPNAGALLAPLPILGYFRLCLRVFVNAVKRNPLDMAYNWNPGLAKDRIFSLTFFLGGMFILMVVTLGLEKLAKAGW